MNKKYCLVSNDEGSYILEADDPKARMSYEGGTMSSRSQSYDSIEELKKDQEVPEEPCKVCNSSFSTRYMQPVKAEMIERNMCFNCNFWTSIVAVKDSRIIMNGVVYRKGEENSRMSRGFGGHEWNIQMNDGTIIKTTNLWCNGEVPERFKEQLPDNAKPIDKLTTV